jgi:hypothetical protein
VPEAQSLLLPKTGGGRELWVTTAGGRETTRAKGFSRALLRACKELLSRADLEELGIRVMRLFPPDHLDKHPPGLAEDVERVRRVLSEYTALRTLIQVRRLLSRLLEDPSLPLQERLAFTQRLVPLTFLDACLEALGAGAALTEEGGQRVELGRTLENFFRDRPTHQIYTRDNLPPDPAVARWWDTSKNDLHHRGMPEDLIDRYQARRMRLGFLEERFRPSLELMIPLKEGGREGELGLLSRVCHPETVLVLEVNERIWIPIRWSSHTQPSASQAVRTGSSRDPFMDPGSMLSGAGFHIADIMAPLSLRRFHLPVGVLQQGENRIKVWSWNARARPDPWMPVLHGVYLRPGEMYRLH